MESHFEIQLLGPPQLRWQGRPFALPRRQARALLFRLAAETGPIPREELADLLWSEIPPATARRNLTRLLSYLRKQLPHPDLILTAHSTVSLSRGAAHADATLFSELCRSEEPASWQSAVSLYRGPFLSGFVLDESREFERWQSVERRRFEELYLKTLRRLVLSGSAGPAQAIRYGRLYLTVDNLAEDVHRQLITLYAQTGDRAAALRQYEACVLVLERELGVKPLPATRAAYEAIRDGRLPAMPEEAPQPQWTTLPGLDLPLAGREEAWRALAGAYDRFAGGGVILISGEAGVGKSRLMQAFAIKSAALVLSGNNQAESSAVPYQPLIQALRQALVSPSLWAPIPSTWLAELSRLMPELPDHFPGLPPPLNVEPQQAEARIFEALWQVFAGLAAASPLLLCLDDIHWADESTRGWLGYATGRLAGSSLCILATFRTQHRALLREIQRSLQRSGLMAEVALEGLAQTAVATLLQQAQRTSTVSKALAARIHAATGGNAFFVLETIRELLETGQVVDPPADLPLPATVREAVLRRAARLSPLAQQILAVAAVLSPQLTIASLQEISGRSEQETVNGLEELLTQQLLQADGQDFAFQHDLAKEAIYDDLALWRRQLLHKRAAEGLERLHQEELAAFYPALAYHWRQVVIDDSAIDSAVASKAIDYLYLAGQQSVTSSANQQAIKHFNNAIILVRRLPESNDRYQQELKLLIALYAPLGVAMGWGSPEIAAAFDRAREICERIGDPGQLFLVLYGLWGYNVTRSNLHTSLKLAEQCLMLAQDVDDPALIMEAHRLIDETLFFRGDFVGAQEHLQQGYALYDPQRHHSHATIYAQDPGVAFLSYWSWIAWLLGYPAQAYNLSHQAVDLAQSQSHLGSQAYALTWKAFLHYMAHDVEETQKLAERTIAISREHGFALFFGVASALKGWALTERGKVDEGLSQIDYVLQASQATGADGRLKIFALQVKAYAQTGQLEKGQTALDDALALVERHEERWWEAELLRLKGELLLLDDQALTQAEAYYLRSIDTAQQQQARSLELRTTISLARLWQQQGKRAEAHRVLSGIFHWFSEGFDTPDLKAAQTLLENLLRPADG